MTPLLCSLHPPRPVPGRQLVMNSLELPLKIIISEVCCTVLYCTWSYPSLYSHSQVSGCFPCMAPHWVLNPSSCVRQYSMNP